MVENHHTLPRRIVHLYIVIFIKVCVGHFIVDTKLCMFLLLVYATLYYLFDYWSFNYQVDIGDLIDKLNATACSASFKLGVRTRFL